MNENAHEAYVDPITGGVIVSEIEPEEVQAAIQSNGWNFNDRVRRALASWAEDVQSTPRRNRTIFARDKYVTPGKVFEQMALAYDSLDDDIIGNVADTSEAIAFQKASFQSEDSDQEDVWNQIARDLDLDSYLRTAWRELFTVSQFYGVKWWGTKTYRVRGEGDGGRKRRKEFEISVPTALGFLDPTRVVPVRAGLFGDSQLAWIGTESERQLLQGVKEGVQTDQLVQSLFVGSYNPTPKEAADFEKEGIQVENLFLLNPTFVFRHTLTRSPFERWARIRMKSIFPILDLKHQLREMDRAWLLGGINFLVLVTRGTDDIPTTRQEVDETTTMMRTQSKTPIIVSDHRIKIEIITPDIQNVIDKDKWKTIDDRLIMRLWGMFNLPSDVGGRENSLTLGRVIARGLGSRRHMLKRVIERELVKPVMEMNPELDSNTVLEFAPRRMELEFDEALITLVQELRDRGDLSRETVLSEFNFDQDIEAQRRKVEKKEYDDIFEPVNVPFDSPNRTTPGGSGRTGGRPAGRPSPNDSGGN